MNSGDQTESKETAQWAYTSGNLVEDGAQALPDEQPATATNSGDEVLLSWTASEFVEHDKNGGWYISLAAVAIVVAVVTFLITKQVLSVIVIILMAVMFGVYGSAKPKVLDYVIMSSGLRVGDKTYPFSTIKSFSVIDEGGMPYVQVLMQKRLSVPVIMYAAPDQIDKVANALGQYVPYDQKKRDFADKLSNRIRF